MFELKCFIHDFETYSKSAWDKHCYETKHTLTIWTKGKKKVIPYPKNYQTKQGGFDDIREDYKFAKLLESFDGIKRTK